jgi:enamine deaminase RidA (YjgF/YER057c/UK114 family)
MSGEHKLISSASPYEPIIGFSRAVRVGGIIVVGGTAPVGRDGKTVGIGDPAAQTRRCLEIIEQALKDAGAGLENVIRTRMFLTDVTQWEAVGHIHGEIFGSIRPASTMVQVSGLIDPDWLVEIEADAVIGEGGDIWQNAWAPSDGTETQKS